MRAARLACMLPRSQRVRVPGFDHLVSGVCSLYQFRLWMMGLCKNTLERFTVMMPCLLIL